jgi:putative radical SAM enzyme (TIGR03279 family)
MYEFAVTPAVTRIRRRGAEITEVASAGIGAELELEPGDRITKVNGRTIRDYLDFRFQAGGETELTIEVRKSSGEDWELQIERDEGEDFGFSFEQIVPRQCANECIFCFCKGNPSDARSSLFVRDEDIRLSFLYGNYTTLTSITEDEMRRIIEQRLSPQYVSIHATDLDVRAHLLGVNKKRADISRNLTRLLDAGIEIHAQVVLCPGINDGEILQRTINDLAADYPCITSVAIVPLALTRYNTDERLTPVTAEFCSHVINEVTELQKELHRRLGTTFAFLGDEIYLRAGHPLPGKSHYGSYPQIEDGIGMVRSFNNDFEKLIKKVERQPHYRINKIRGTVFTGTMFAPILKAQIETLNHRAGTELTVIGVENNYFGGDVSVAGLLTGGDLLAARDQIQGDFVVIPRSTLKSDEDIFLDGMSLAELREKLAMPVHPVDLHSFASFLFTPGFSPVVSVK